jgi:predicted transcriptional regulator
MRIRDLKPRDAIGVDASETLRGAAKHLADDEIGVLIVWGSRGAIGVISERDVARAIADGMDVDEVPVEDYMTEAPVTVRMDDSVGAAVAKMNEFALRHVVVVDDSSVCGVVSMRDILELLGTRWPEL